MQVGATGSSLDVNSIVSQLMAVERQPLTSLARKESQVQAKISAFGSLKSALSSLQTAAGALDNAEKFRAMRVSVGDATLLSAAPGTSAVPGSYAVEVLALAQAHKLQSSTYASTNTVLGEGAITFQYGTYDSGGNSFSLNAAKSSQTVSIGAGQSNLAGIRDTVNAANIGVSASIVNDGSGPRLLFSSKDSGLENSLRITVADADGNHTDTSGLSALAFDPTQAAGAGKNLTQTVAVQNASLRVDGILISQASNAVTGAIDGVTLNLQKTGVGTPTTLTVSRDTAGVKTAVQGFVKAFNEFNASIKSLTGYNAETKVAGPLQGDPTALALVTRLRSQIASGIGAGTLKTLSQIGVSQQKDGALAFDTTKFDAAMVSGFDSMAGLFARIGTPSNTPYVTYSGSSIKTAAGTYGVVVSQPATRGELAGSAAAGLTVTAGVNDRIDFQVDGIAASVTLEAQTYASATALGAALQARINGVSTLAAAGIKVTVTQAAGILSLRSDRYGAASAVSVTGGNGATALLGGTPLATAGLDVAGTINGANATGTGQTLVGATGNDSEGLALTITADTPGDLGTVAFSLGHASRIGRIADEFLTSGGSLAGRIDGLNARVKEFGRRAETFNNRMVDIERRYRAQYAALDASLSRMNNTSNYLSTQLANLPNNRTR